MARVVVGDPVGEAVAELEPAGFDQLEQQRGVVDDRQLPPSSGYSLRSVLSE